MSVTSFRHYDVPNGTGSMVCTMPHGNQDILLRLRSNLQTLLFAANLLLIYE